MAEDIDKLSRSVDDLVKQLSKSAGMFGRVHGGSGGGSSTRDRAADKDSKERSGARKKLWNDFNKGSSGVNYKLGRMAQTFAGITASGDGLMHGLEGLLAGIAGGRLITELLQGSTKLASTYRDLSRNGLTFSGSMLDMAASAAQAGMPLAEFAEMMKRASTTGAVLNNNYARTGVSLGSLQMEVRNNLESYGMLGMSLRDIGGLTADYANTMRLQGHMADMNTKETGKSIATLAINIANFSSATGVARDEIEKRMNSALTDVAVTSKMWQSNNVGQAEALRTSTAFLSAIPGEFGSLLPKMLAESFGYGSTLLSEGAKTFYEAGAQDFVGVIDDMKTKVDKGSFTAEDAGDTFDKLRRVGDQNEGMLRMQAAAGNTNARQVLGFIAEMRGLSREDFIRQKQDEIGKQAFTNFILNIESTFDKLTGAFRSGFYDSIKGLEDSFAALSGSGLIDTLMVDLKAFGTVVGGIVTDVFSPENMRWLSGQLTDFGTWLKTIPSDGRVVKEWLGYIKTAFEVARPILSGFFDIMGFIARVAALAGNGFMVAYDALAKLNKTVADVGAALALFLGYKVFKSLFAQLMGKSLGVAAANVDVTAPVVNLTGPVTVNGMGGGGGFGGGGGANPLQAMMDGGLEDKKLGRMGRARVMANELGNKGRLSRMGGSSLHWLLDRAEGVANSGMGRAMGRMAGSASEAVAGSGAMKMGLSLAKGLGKGVIGAVSGLVVDKALSYLPDSRGKRTAQSMSEYAGYGAMAGTLLPIPGVGTGLGAGIGAMAGAAIANWDVVSGLFTSLVEKASPNTPSPAGPTDPSQGPEIDALKAKVLELGQEQVDVATGPNGSDEEHKRKMADLQQEIRDCMQAMLQIQDKQSDHLRGIERSNKEIAANQT